MTTEATNQVPATDPTAAATPAATPAATGAAVETQENKDAAKARRKLAAQEKELEDLRAQLKQVAEQSQTEAEKERLKAIEDAKASVIKDYEAKIARQQLETAALLHLGAKVGADAAKLLVPAVLASDNDLTAEDVPDAVEKLLSTLQVQKGPGGQGGSPSVGTTGKNPWKRETWNVTEQMALIEEAPEKARALAAAAGVVLP